MRKKYVVLVNGKVLGIFFILACAEIYKNGYADAIIREIEI